MHHIGFLVAYPTTKERNCWKFVGNSQRLRAKRLPHRWPVLLGIGIISRDPAEPENHFPSEQILVNKCVCMYVCMYVYIYICNASYIYTYVIICIVL